MLGRPGLPGPDGSPGRRGPRGPKVSIHLWHLFISTLALYAYSHTELFCLWPMATQTGVSEILKIESEILKLQIKMHLRQSFSVISRELYNRLLNNEWGTNKIKKLYI